MLGRRGLVAQSLQSNLKFFFASGQSSKMMQRHVRMRNFFEVDPIFPDRKDEDVKLYRDSERFIKGKNQFNERVTFERHTSHMVKRIQQSLEREEKIKKLKGQKNKKLSEELESLKENIFLDEETKLPFGIGFDDYIELVKEESITTRTGQFNTTLEIICRKIGAYNEIELVKFYQFLLAEKSQDLFKNEARHFLVSRILQEMHKLGWNSELSKSYLQKNIDTSKADTDFIETALSDPNEEAFSQRILPLINDDLVSERAKQLALQNLQDKIRFNTNLKAVKLPPRRIDQDDPFFSEESDRESSFSEPLLNFQNLKPTTKDFVDPFQTVGRKVLEEQQIWSKVKRNYYENKRRFYKENVYTEEDKIKDIKRKKDESIDLVSFLVNSKDEQEIKNLLNKYNLVDDAIPHPDFKEILSNIDYLVDKASTSIKVQIAKKNNEGKDLYFRGNFLNEKLKPEDLMWKHFQKNFLAIFPEPNIEHEQSAAITFSENDIRFSKKELDIFENTSGNSKDTEKKRYTEKDLSLDNQMELEIYRRTKQDPFFRHYLQNEIKYFTDRINDGFLDIAQGFVPADRKHDTSFFYDPSTADIPNDLIGDDELRLKYEQLKKEKAEGIRVFESGKRKTSSCLVMIKEGTGKVFVNGQIFYHYFSHPFNRNIALKPMLLSTQYCEYDIHYYVRGGGVMAQSHACQMALARGLLQLHPSLRPLFMKYYRQKERKKTGRYKARKAHTYVRR